MDFFQNSSLFLFELQFLPKNFVLQAFRDIFTNRTLLTRIGRIFTGQDIRSALSVYHYKTKIINLSALRKLFCNVSRKASKVRKVYHVKYLYFVFIAFLREISLVRVDP